MLPLSWERPHRNGLQKHLTMWHQRLHKDAPPSSSSSTNQIERQHVQSASCSNRKHWKCREWSGIRHGGGCACSHYDKSLTDVNASGPLNGASDASPRPTFRQRQRSSGRRKHAVVSQFSRCSGTRHPGRVKVYDCRYAQRTDTHISNYASQRTVGKLQWNVPQRASHHNR